MPNKFNPYEASARYYNLTKKLLKYHDTKVFNKLDEISTRLKNIETALEIKVKV